MKSPCLKWLSSTLLSGLVLAAGCNRPTPPPEPLPANELPAALEQAFSKAKPEVKGLAAQVVTATQAKDYSKAFMALQTLAATPGLTKDQVSVVSRGTMTLNELLQAAQTQGDQKATRTLQRYQLDK